MKKKIFYILIPILIFLIIVIIKAEKNNDIKFIGDIAYDVNSNIDNVVYIKENGEYVPYLVLTKNFNNSNNSLLLREYIIGGKDSSDTIVPFSPENIIYEEQMEMPQNTNYEQTYVDNYLNNEFSKIFDKDLIDNVKLTEIDVTNNFSEEKSNYKIKRRFFLLSSTEVGLSNTWDNSNKKQLKYFASDDSRIAKNESNLDVVWWLRSYCSSSFCAIDKSGWLITESSTNIRYGVRPAFTISNKTKIKKEYNKDISKEITVLDL